ncbi:virulence RhuM family protein [Nocardia farcinica]|nr:virulence RhuM family protein [Nocardia farcinica]
MELAAARVTQPGSDRVIADGEVTEATINSELMVRQEGARQVRREVKHFNLEMVLAVGYRPSRPSRTRLAGTRSPRG